MKVMITSTGNGARYMKVIILLVLLVVLIFSLGLYLSNNFVLLQVRVFDTGRVVFHKILKINESFTLEYIHSVTKQPVYEVFYVKDATTLAMQEMRYDSFGANLPVGSEKLTAEETKFIVTEEYYLVLYENRIFDVVPLRVGQMVAEHTLTFEDNVRLRFLDIVGGGEYVEFYVKPLLEIFED